MTTQISLLKDPDAQLVHLSQAKQAGWQDEVAVWIAKDGWLQRRCAFRLGSVVDAEDAVQEITIKVLALIGKFQQRSTLRTWVIRIADNHCHTFAKARDAKAMSEHLRHCVLLFEADRVVEAGEPEFGEQHKAVHSALKNMPARNREVLALRFFSEQSLDEIARTLGLSLSATKMRLYRAMDSFRDIYTSGDEAVPVN